MNVTNFINLCTITHGSVQLFLTGTKSTYLQSSNFWTSNGMWRAVRTSGLLRYVRRFVPLVQGGSSCTFFLKGMQL